MERTKKKNRAELEQDFIDAAVTSVTSLYSEQVKYDCDAPRKAYHMASMGHNNNEIALVLGVSAHTIENWMRDRPEFERAVMVGRSEVDDKVEATLLQCCLGYSVKKMVRASYKGEYGSEIEITEQHEPNGNLCLQWLRARRSEVWAETKKIETKTNITLTKMIDKTDITDEDLKMIEHLGLKHLNANNETNN